MNTRIEEIIYSRRRKTTKRYHLKIVSGLRLDSLIDLFGVDGAIAVLQRFGGTRFYIPKLRSIRHEIRLAAMRSEGEKLKEEGLHSGEIIEFLRQKYGCAYRTAEKQFYQFGKSIVKEEERKIRDKRLMMIVQKYGDKLEEAGLI